VAERPGRASGSVAPGKLILIGVLAVVLVAVLYAQFGGRGSAAERTAGKSTPGRQATDERVSAADTDKQARGAETDNEAVRVPVDRSAWNPPDLATVVAYDPFALPSRFPQPRLEESKPASESDAAKRAVDGAQALEQVQKQLDDMRQLGVKVILEQHGQYVALIGNQTIRVGDEVNGFTVTEITPTGVRVERKIEE
jgi:hypothetical protein